MSVGHLNLGPFLKQLNFKNPLSHLSSLFGVQCSFQQYFSYITVASAPIYAFLWFF